MGGSVVDASGVIWEESHTHREVAQYVRWKVRAEQGDLKAAAEARQLSDRLGLNPLALMRLRPRLSMSTRWRTVASAGGNVGAAAEESSEG
ncbi:hypothetical protein SAMN04488548_1162 [Gordonia westfalica]|uniref:Uncharacterized protein n=1 Tax=Gordonia westfalica TaxID=158898 RepID=A0A1H2DQJ0_9ACTN|nr:hypothetical protein SAMN04488548_1162 [Gordonia westfalica]